MPLPFLVPAIISGISALGGLLSNRKKTNTQLQESTQNIDRTTTQMPTYDPAALAMRNSLMRAFSSRMSPDYINNLTGSITAGNVQNINRGFGASRRALEESLAAKGFNFSPI